MESGSITAAVILAAIISVITLIIGRGTKITDFRQAWINDQRADFGNWAAAALALVRNEFATCRATDLNILEQTAFRIRLRENPGKKEWKPVIEKMDAVRAVLLSAPAGSQIAVFDEIIAIAALAQVRLKKDWNKVRFGEAGYRAMILLLPSLFVPLLLFGYYAMVSGQNPFASTGDRAKEHHISGSIQLIAATVKSLPVTSKRDETVPKRSSAARK